MDGGGKKAFAAVHEEVTREVSQFLGRVFQERRKTGRHDLEALEMALRTAMHHAGATALTELMRFAPPAADQRDMACPCGQQAHYRELRSNTFSPPWAR